MTVTGRSLRHWFIVQLPRPPPARLPDDRPRAARFDQQGDAAIIAAIAGVVHSPKIGLSPKVESTDSSLVPLVVEGCHEPLPYRNHRPPRNGIGYAG